MQQQQIEKILNLISRYVVIILFIFQMEGNKDTEKKLSRWKKMWLSISMKTKIRFSYRRGSKSNHPTDKEIEQTRIECCLCKASRKRGSWSKLTLDVLFYHRIYCQYVKLFDVKNVKYFDIRNVSTTYFIPNFTFVGMCQCGYKNGVTLMIFSTQILDSGSRAI